MSEPPRLHRPPVPVFVPDPTSAAPFYAALLEARAAPGEAPATVAVLVDEDDGATWTSLVLAPGALPDDPRRRGSPVLELRVDDVEDKLAQLVALGCRVRLRIPDAAPIAGGPPTRYAQIDDPWGYRWAIALAE